MRIAVLAVALALPAAALAAQSAAPARRAVLLRATGSNLHPGHLSAATDMLRSYLERTGRFQVTIVAGPGGGSDQATPAQAGEAARAAGADLAFTLHIARLGSNALVRLAAHRQDGSVEHLDELSAASPEDVERVLQRLAEGAAAGKPAREIASIDSVTEREADAYLKYAATNVFGVRVGGQYVLNRPDASDRSSTPAGVGVFWLYDARKYLADLSADFYGGSDDRIFALGIGVFYPFSRANETPYVGARASWSSVEFASYSASGLVASAGGGILFGRLSTLQIRIDAGYSVNLFQVKNSLTGEARTAHGPYLTVGIGF